MTKSKVGIWSVTALLLGLAVLPWGPGARATSEPEHGVQAMMVRDAGNAAYSQCSQNSYDSAGNKKGLTICQNDRLFVRLLDDVGDAKTVTVTLKGTVYNFNGTVSGSQSGTLNLWRSSTANPQFNPNTASGWTAVTNIAFATNPTNSSSFSYGAGQKRWFKGIATGLGVGSQYYRVDSMTVTYPDPVQTTLTDRLEVHYFLSGTP